ncbi:MAG TPA: hypothetical protein VFY06_01225 [Verrucomicrobiae bacterium]|nr:hypothetical protein [Verrucomicrobiae bacterium]
MKIISSGLMGFSRVVGFILLLLIALPLASRAKTLVVTNLADSGAGSLREAVAVSGPGDVISIITNGTITLSSGELFMINDLTISGPGPTNLFLEVGYVSRILEISNASIRLGDLAVARS